MTDLRRSPSGKLTSVFGRAGAVVAALGDYAASLVTNDSSMLGATVKDALDVISGVLTSHEDSIIDFEGLATASKSSGWPDGGTGAAASRVDGTLTFTVAPVGLAEDRLHPTMEGYQIWGAAIAHSIFPTPQP